MKKILALLMAVCLTVAMLAGCGSAPADPVQGATAQPAAEQPAGEPGAEKETVTLKVWADQGELELTEKLCSDFAAAHPEKEYVFEFAPSARWTVRAAISKIPRPRRTYSCLPTTSSSIS